MTSRECSKLEEARVQFQPLLPSVFADLIFVEAKEMGPSHCQEKVAALFPKTAKQPSIYLEKGEMGIKRTPLRVGVLFSGGQAPGGHNVLGGLFDGIAQFHPDSHLIGFLGGPSGLIENKFREITAEMIDGYRNRGGFDLLGSGRTKIETKEQFQAVLKTVLAHNLSGLVIIGGDDSNTNAAHLAEYLLTNGCETKVIGVPKTIDGDLKSEKIEISFGFDTACKVYSELIGNIARDALSSKKYYHFIKLMGRSASHVALECAFQTQPNYTLIGEEVAAKKRKLKEIVNEIADLVVERSEKGKNYGLILVPEGLIEFIPEMKALIKELNAALASHPEGEVMAHLSNLAKESLTSLPEKIQKQLLMERDPHGNVQVSMIATEELLIEMVKKELKARANTTVKFSAVAHFMGYEGRAAFPSNFDANYTYGLGTVAATLIALGLTGTMAALFDLTRSPSDWRAGGISLVSMMHMEERKGKEVAVIAKSLVDLKGAPFTHFVEKRNKWRLEDNYQCPGPIQFFGPAPIVDATTLTLQLEVEERKKG